MHLQKRSKEGPEREGEGEPFSASLFFLSLSLFSNIYLSLSFCLSIFSLSLLFSTYLSLFIFFYVLSLFISLFLFYYSPLSTSTAPNLHSLATAPTNTETAIGNVKEVSEERVTVSG
jgi:hypothetical protein